MRACQSSSELGPELAERPAQRVGYGLAVCVVLGAAVSVFPLVWAAPQQRLLRAAAQELSAARHAEAERLARLVLKEPPKSIQALLIAGQAASKLQHSEQALAYYGRIPDDGSAEAAQALLGSAQRFLRLGKAADAERCLRRVLEIDPGLLEAHKEIAYLLAAQGRTWDALPHLQELIRGNDFTGDHLLMAGALDSQFLNEPQFVAECQAASPDDPLPLFIQARISRLRNENEAARETLSQIVTKHPELIEAQAEYGHVLLDSTPEAFLAWLRALPPEADEHPEIWFLRGVWAKRAGQSQAAVRCFWETVRRRPDHPAASYQLSQLLAALGEKRMAEPFANRSQRLARVEALLAEVRNDLQSITELAAQLERLGRLWEAAGWAHLALRRQPQTEWAEQLLRRLDGTLMHNPEWNLISANPAAQVDLSNWPLPDWGSATPARTQDAEAMADAMVSFEDSAASAGLAFHYYNGADPQGRRAYMFEFNGGGAAVLDFDGDGWPDLYLTQGCAWPPDAEQQEHLDRLYRNLGDGRFADATSTAGLGDHRFSQGAAVGDFNSDGFPDLYLGNIGVNRLYQNNGDGTFSDVTEISGMKGAAWTSSCVIADFNGDAWPDIYAATYLAGPEVFEKACDDNGKPVQCGPILFAAEQDRFYLNLGDGRFQDVSAEAGLLAPEGKGLGVVAADFDGSRRLGLFVSNDTTANFFFANQTPSRGASPAFAERGILCGVGLDEAGKAQACMGIAAGDANGDGLLDLFVTNFFREPNTLYVQQPDGTFVDGTRRARLYDPSFPMLGWGTQFLDGELDGNPDLMVMNGHINDLSHAGTPYKMPPQYFRNQGDGTFAELPGSTLGPYFEGKRLGRALVRLDWNRDGLEDVCATHVDTPAALLTNRTERHGRFLAVQLRGVHSDRDAIGTTVRVVAAGRTYVRQLTAGDGFQASNERQLVFGLGEADLVDELTVLWPAGLDQTLRDVSVDQTIVVVEGRKDSIQLRPTRFSDVATVQD
ncbi:MAG TPA: FG-GAP-like repeat-containing protein [Pirellulales bacterium]|nr:FG-GAP-like repeat-containing protein [Pirellulales bacterium]